jgi:pyruvate,water dikinase
MDEVVPLAKPLASDDVSLAMFGGKGRSLAKLAAARLPVPEGFLLSTEAYRRFVKVNELQETILQTVADAAADPTASLELACAHVQSLFEAAKLPREIAESITQAYAALVEDEWPVAVRSSATGEDLPTSSFAGQHDTFLNVRGESAVLHAVRRCWASLWTARAIGYRIRMDINQRSVAMGVVIQRMVAAEASGVVFTANPATGNRSELVVNASFGLGEAIVGGQVTPDTYVLDGDTLEIKESAIGSKERMTVLAVEQGTMIQPVPAAKREGLSLSTELVRELAALCRDAETLFDHQPQDIEWGLADGKVWLLQSRGITNLPPPPLPDVTWDPPSEGTKLIRRQVVENMPDPLSPLFDELYLRVGLDQAVDHFLIDFGMRHIESLIESPFFLTVNGYAYCRGSYRLSWRIWRYIPSILYAYVKVVPRLLRNVKSRWRDEALPRYLATIKQWKSVDLDTAADEQLLSGVRALATADAHHWFNVTMMVAAAKITDGLLNRYLQSWCVPGNLTSGMFLRGFPSRTMEAQAELEAIATRIRCEGTLGELVRNSPSHKLLDALRQDRQGCRILAEILGYLDRYGHQVYNLDFAEPTPVEDPTVILLSLRTLVMSEGIDTPTRQAELGRERDALIQHTLSSLGPLRRWLFRKLLAWADAYGPCREEALFYMGAAWSTLRSLALELGQRLVAVGTLTKPDDVFYLDSGELAEACLARGNGWARHELGRTARERRELRESRKRLHPPGIIPPGSRWTLGPLDLSAFETQKRNAGDTDTLHGFAVSPGTATGVATVIRSPVEFGRMQPASILVCPTTTPAWTPLFAQALGLVTDIGGILAHGSIVAREYGIPAVLGTGNGTQRIVTGQRITVDGDAGTVTILR